MTAPPLNVSVNVGNFVKYRCRIPLGRERERERGAHRQSLPQVQTATTPDARGEKRTGKEAPHRRRSSSTEKDGQAQPREAVSSLPCHKRIFTFLGAADFPSLASVCLALDEKKQTN